RRLGCLARKNALAGVLFSADENMRACARAPPTNGPPLQRRRSVAVPTSCLTYLRVRRHRQWLMSSKSYPQTPMSYNMASYPARFDQEWLACREADCRALRSIQRKRPRVPCDRCRLQKDESNLCATSRRQQGGVRSYSSYRSRSRKGVPPPPQP